jgi:hypothetical protein
LKKCWWAGLKALIVGLWGYLKMKKNILLVGLPTVILLALFSLISMNFLGLNQLLRADSTISFVKLIEKENVQDNVLGVLYTSLLADYCTLKADRQSLVFKYSLAEDFSAKIIEIETLFQSTLKAQHQRLRFDCNAEG